MQLLHFSAVDWLTGMGLQRLLSGCKRCWRRWRRGLGNHRALGDSSWWRRNTICGVGVCSQHSGLSWRHRCAGTDRGSFKVSCIHRNSISRNRLRAGECALRYSGNRTLHVSIRIVNVCNRRGLVNNRRVVDVRDGRRVDVCVSYVDPVYVCLADPIRGHINFSRTEGKPTNVTRCQAAAHERHKCWCIHRTIFSRTWNPAPLSVDRGPTSVMERRVAPRIIVNPSPSPRINPRPTSFAVRRPAGIYSREPHISIR